MKYFPKEVFRQGFDFAQDTPCDKIRTIQQTGGGMIGGTAIGVIVDILLKTPGICAVSSTILGGGLGLANMRTLIGFERVFSDEGILPKLEK